MVRITDRVYGWNQKIDSIMILGDPDYMGPRIIQIPNIKRKTRSCLKIELIANSE
jgi:hypothetical protein